MVIGIPVLKLKGHYLAMATLGFGTIVYRIFLATPYFGEADGLTEVPGFHLLPFLTISGDSTQRVLNFYAAWILLIVGMLLLINLIGSRVGRALRSLHSSEEAAEASGVNTARFKLQVFVLSAVYAAIAGRITSYNVCYTKLLRYFTNLENCTGCTLCVQMGCPAISWTPLTPEEAVARGYREKQKGFARIAEVQCNGCGP